MNTEPGAPDTGATATLVDLTAGGNRYPSHQAARLGADIAAALAERHARGRAYGALTPNAVVVAPGNRLALLEPDDPSLAGPDRGMWTAYAAPEQLLDGTLTPASDVYALGGLMVLMLTGGPPFEEFDPDRLRERKLTEVAPAPSAAEPMLPAALDELVRRMLDRDPVRRPTAHESATRLLELAQVPTAPAAATPPPRTVITETTVERRGPDPWVYVLGAVILIAVVALVIALVARDDSPAKTTVPAVTGLQVAEATNVLRTDHLKVDTVTSPDATVAAGLVASQTPPAGTRVNRGRTVVLTVSSGVPAAPTPIPIPVPVPQGSASTTTTTSTSTTTTTTTTTPPAT